MTPVTEIALSAVSTGVSLAQFLQHLLSPKHSTRQERAGPDQYKTMSEGGLSECYADESAVTDMFNGKTLPYTEEIAFFSHPAVKSANVVSPKDVSFHIGSTDEHMPASWPATLQIDSLYALAAEAFKAEGRRWDRDLNVRTIRVDNVTRGDSGVVFHVSPTCYNMQVVTNLTPDMLHTDGSTWRSKLRNEHGTKLSPLLGSPLANNLGVSIILIYGRRKKYVLVPLRPQLAVWGCQWGCSSSFTTSWEDLDGCPRQSDGSITLEDFIERVAKPHLELELGRTIRESTSIEPLVFCREWLRAGLPQLMLGARTRLSLRQIRRGVRTAAHRDEIKKGMRPGFYRDRILADARNMCEHPASQELRMNTLYLNRRLQTDAGKQFYGSEGTSDRF